MKEDQDIESKKEGKELFRTYHLKHFSNKEKEDKVVSVVREYRKTAIAISNHQWVVFFKEGKKFNKNLKINEINSKLSERYKQTCQYQVVSQLNSYIQNAKHRFVDMVLSYDDFDKETRIKLFYINKYEKWFHGEVKMRGELIEYDIIKLARKLFKHLIKNKPRFNNINMQLDHKVAVLLTKKQVGASEFDYWLKLSTLKKGNPIYLPIDSNEYFKSIEGITKKSYQIILTRQREIKIGVVKEIMPELIEYGIKKIGIDIGTNVFIATQGRLLGQKMMKYIKKYDSIITKLQRNLNKNNLKPSDNKRFNHLISKVKSFIKNEVGRIINRIIKYFRPEEIVKEKLNFKGSNIGKINNRILSKFGKGVLEKRLENISAKHDIKITEVPAPYTSQECSNCHYTRKNNRKVRDIFKCGYCGLKLHADINAERNTLVRSSGEFNNLNKRKIFDLLMEKHEKWKELRCYSSAKGGTSKTSDVVSAQMERVII